MHIISMLISNPLVQARVDLLFRLEVQWLTHLLPINPHLHDSQRKFNFWTLGELEDVQGGTFLSWEILTPLTNTQKWNQFPWICTQTPCIILPLTIIT